MAQRIIDVNTGQIHLATGDAILRAAALGSCIAVVAYDIREKIGAIAHVMLPGTAPADCKNKNKYASNAIKEMLTKMIEAGSKSSNIKACIVGAGNVLEKEDDIICDANVRSVNQLLKDHNISIKASVVGGTKRKSVLLDIENRTVSYTHGDSELKLLWKASKTAIMNDFDE